LSTSRQLLHEIARCPNVQQCLGTASPHPCQKVVHAQELRVAAHQLPEPWNGRIETAPILFVSSNPSFNPREQFPNLSWGDEQIATFFTTRFDHSDQSSHFWRVVRRIAEALLGRPPRPGVDYALTEIVRCKSRKEEGVVDAIRECAPRYLARTFEVAGATVIVALGKKARNIVATEVGVGSDIGLHGPVDIATKPRFILMLGHPSAAERKKPTIDEIRALQSHLV
jgi:hypothetical protein